MMKNQQNQVDNITKQLIARYKPEKIILFGSAVWGKSKKFNDLDFLIIKKRVPYLGRDRIRQLDRLIETDCPCDFIVAKPQEIQKRLSLEDPFVEKIMKEGMVLYG